MKNRYFLFALLVFSSACYINAQNYLNGPECVSYDSLNNRYLVDNWNNGSVISVDSAGNQSYFVTGLGHAYGNVINDSIIYISTGTSILGLNLFNALDTIFLMQVPGASQIDGITLDDNNNLYAVEVIQASVIKINLQTHTSSVFVNGLSARPQDIIFDQRKNRLLVCSWYSNSPIQSVSLLDSSVTTLINTVYGNCDGLAMDENGNVYFSTWTDNSVYYYDSTFTNPPAYLTQGLNGPSNICYNFKNNILAIPNFNSNTLELVEINPTAVDNQPTAPKYFQLLQNYPNPFNPNTVISYQLSETSNVLLKVYDALGNEVATLVNAEKPAGNYEVVFNGTGLPSGIYFYKLKAGSFIESSKMILLK